MFLFETVNYWAVLATGVLSFILGMLWYSPVLFANPWMKELGMTNDDIKKRMDKQGPMIMILGFVGGLITSFVMAHVVIWTDSVSFGAGAVAGFIIWLGFALPLVLGKSLWEAASWKLFWINVGFFLVDFLLIGGILAVWR